jgi:hypothetical protein
VFFGQSGGCLKEDLLTLKRLIAFELPQIRFPSVSRL